MIFRGLTHPVSVYRVIFKNFYLFLTSNIEDFDLKVNFLAVIIDNIQSSDNEDVYLLIEMASNLLKDISE
jgi:uncharacterized protein YsxB (DUF464 family)